jgi:hypothetical protein
MSSSALARTFQLPARLPVRRAREIRDELSTLWQDAAGNAPGVLEDDLEILRKRFFDPVAQGKRLRGQLVELPPRPSAQTLAEPLRLLIDDARVLITPEGRCAMDLLQVPQRDETALELAEDDARDLEAVLLAHYRRWGRHRIDQVVALLGDEALRPPVIGVLLMLLVNRSIGFAHAVLRYEEGPERDAIDEAFRQPVGRFAQAIDPGQRRSLAKERLISGWTLHELTRRYPQAIRIDDAADVSRVYITEGTEDLLLDAVARAMARKHIGQRTAGDAYDQLVESLRSQGRTLAGYDMLFERPADTAQLRDRLLAKLQERQAELQRA